MIFPGTEEGISSNVVSIYFDEMFSYFGGEKISSTTAIGTFPL